MSGTTNETASCERATGDQGAVRAARTSWPAPECDKTIFSGVERWVIPGVAVFAEKQDAILGSVAPELLTFAKGVSAVFDDAKYPHSVEGQLRDAARALVAKAERKP